MTKHLTRNRIPRLGMWFVGLLCFNSWANAQESTEQAPALPPSEPPAYVPLMPPGHPPPFSPRVPSPAAVDARFDPDNPDVQLLSLSAEIPFEHVAAGRRGWWRPGGYSMGFGLAPVYAPLCDGPCNLRLMRGPYHLALSKRGGTPVPVEQTVFIGGSSTLHAHYVDRSGIRTAGAVIGIVGTIGGLVMIMASIHEERTCDGYGYCYRHDQTSDPLLISGIGLFLGSAIASSIMIWQRDEATLTIAPLRIPNASRTFRDARTPLAALGLPGAAATVTF